MTEAYTTNADYWTEYIKPYVADLGVSLVFGLGYFLLKSLKKDRKSDSKQNLKSQGYSEKIISSISQWEEASSLQRYHSLILNSSDQKIDAYAILAMMQKNKLTPDAVTYNCLLDMSYRFGHYSQASRLYEEISDYTSPVQPDVVTYNIMLKNSIKEVKSQEGRFHLQCKEEIRTRVDFLLGEMSLRNVKPNDITYNSAIDVFIQAGDFERSWGMYEKMKLSDVKPDIFTYATLIKGLKFEYSKSHFSEGNLDKAIEILREINSGKIKGITPDEILYNSIIDMCAHYEKLDLAEFYFEEMKSNGRVPNEITYSIMIKAYGSGDAFHKALKLYEDMKSQGMSPNEITYGCLLNSAIKSNQNETIISIYNEMLENNIKPNYVIYSTLIKGLNKARDFSKAFDLFNSIRNSLDLDNPSSIVIYNSILDCCVEAKDYERLNSIFQDIKHKAETNENFKPSLITFSTLIKGLARCGKFDEVKENFDCLKKNHGKVYDLDEVIFNSIADSYAKGRLYDQAEKVLTDMIAMNVKRSSVIYSILIKMHSNRMDLERALFYYDAMLSEGIRPTMITYTTLIQLFIRKKNIQKAIELFESVCKEFKADHVMYNFIINGCTFNRKLEKAIVYLIESLDRNVRLNDDTYSNVVEYLLSNKFMGYRQRYENAKILLEKFQQREVYLHDELYGRLAKLIYQNNEKKNKKEFLNSNARKGIGHRKN